MIERSMAGGCIAGVPVPAPEPYSLCCFFGGRDFRGTAGAWPLPFCPPVVVVPLFLVVLLAVGRCDGDDDFAERFVVAGRFVAASTRAW